MCLRLVKSRKNIDGCGWCWTLDPGTPPVPVQPPLSHLALGLSVGTSALIAALLLVVSGVMISE